MTSVALIFGLNYTGTSSALRGCINDARNMAKYVRTIGYNDVRVFTDANPRTRIQTTKSGILNVLKRHALRAKQIGYKNLLIHYSGHGSYVRDRNGDEKDGYDEALVPSDYKRAGFLLDDELHQALLQFPASTNIKIIMDCCHSGTICDLSYRKASATAPLEVVKSKNPIKSNCIMISGCMDSQTSADAYNMQNQGQFSGALTTTLLNCMKSNKDVKVLDLLRIVQDDLEHRGFSQKPQACGSFDFTDSTFW